MLQIWSNPSGPRPGEGLTLISHLGGRKENVHDTWPRRPPCLVAAGPDRCHAAIDGADGYSTGRQVTFLQVRLDLPRCSLLWSTGADGRHTAVLSADGDGPRRGAAVGGGGAAGMQSDGHQPQSRLRAVPALRHPHLRAGGPKFCLCQGAHHPGALHLPMRACSHPLVSIGNSRC